MQHSCVARCAVSETQHVDSVWKENLTSVPWLQRSGRNIDFDSYLLPPGTADVFFPTHFPSLEALWRESRRQAHGEGSAAKVSSEVLSTAEFMNLYADTKRTKTMTAFNPLVDDFRNTAFFLGSSKV
jgi:hypothetical protein